METGKWIFILGMGFTTFIYGIIVYMVAIRKDYFLINGYEGRSAEEKQYLEESGYLRANGKLLISTFWVLLASFILGLFGVPYGFEIGMALFVILLLGGLFWVQKYEVSHKRNRMRWITGVIAIATIGFVVWITYEGLGDNSFVITEEAFEVTGAYGIEWDMHSIEDVQLLDELPEVRLKTNGTNIGGLLKGKFRLVDPYGSGKLFIHNYYKTTKVLYIERAEDFVMISRETDEETIALYEKLKDVLD